TVQWQISTGGGAFTNIPGATSPTLTLNSVTGAQNGNEYQAVFTNSCAVVASLPATLTVNVAPAITGSPMNQTVCSSGSVSFTAAASGTPAPTVQWQVSNNGGPFANVQGATSTTLTLNSVSPAQNGNTYQAVFANGCNTATSSEATLTVNVAPAVTSSPINQTVCAGGSVSFTAGAIGTPAPAVQWQVSSGGGAFTNIAGATSTTLTLNSVTFAQNGNKYQAVFTNSCNTAASSAGTLTVNTGAVVTVNPVSQSVAASTVTFTAAASGSPAPTIQWQVSTNGGTTFANIPGATSTTLTFSPTPSQSDDKYRAVFTSGCATATTSAATLTFYDTCIQDNTSRNTLQL
ncbi:MAG: immunoglobulin domain-containing protein, partial [Blastocatellia bacterium]